MRRSTAAVLVLCVCDVLSSCGGSTSPGASTYPTAPARAQGMLSGTIISTLTGNPIPNATVRASDVQARTSADGRFELSQPASAAVPVQASITADGYLTRETQLTASDNAIDLIPTSGGFDLVFYRALARNGYDESSKLDVIRTWSTAPRYYIRTVFADDPSRGIDADALAQLQAELPRATAAFSAGRFTNVSIDTGTGERQRTTGLVIVTLYRNSLPSGANYCGYAYIGPPSSEVSFSVDKIGCACGSRKIPVATVWHEIGHVMGMRHTPQVNHNLMAPMLEDQCGTSPHLSPQEELHVPVVNRRPFGNADLDKDPTFFSLLRPDAATQPAVACGKK